jgi:hypothetical protein
MPKPLIDSDDPNLKRLNEILIDHLTKHLPFVATWKLMFADMVGLAFTPIGMLTVLVKDFVPLLLSVGITAVLFLFFPDLTISNGILFFLLLIFVLSKEFRKELFSLFFHFINLVTLGGVIKRLAKGYQSENPIAHTFLRIDGSVFNLLGTYAESLGGEEHRNYHKCIDLYVTSRNSNSGDFETFAHEYWKARTETETL